MTAGRPYRRPNRKGGATNRRHTVVFTMCERCDKRSYSSRADARKQRTPRNHTYPCPHVDGQWHNGYMQSEITSGEIPRTEFYGPNGRGKIRFSNADRRNAA